MTTTKEAVEIILKSASVKNLHEEIYVSNCIDRVCYENIVSTTDIPTFTRSAMDGYALRFGKSKRYKITKKSENLQEGCCVRINTGFPIPENADAVAEIEKVKIENGYAVIDSNIEKLRNFTKQGTEIKKGDILIKKGERIGTRKRALIAYAGIVTLKVYQMPIVGIITTGDEVVFPSCSAPKNSVYNSNFFILEGLVRKWLSSPVYFGHIPDDENIFKERLMYALDRCDVVLTTGGVSKGTKDYTKGVLENIGAKLLFDKTTIKPGKPAAVSVYGDKFIFALPGWPAALYTTAYLYLKPFLLKFAGLKDYRNKFLKGILDEDMHSQKDKDYFNRVTINYTDGQFYLKSAGSQKTDNYSSIARAEGLAWLDTEKEDEKKGSELPFILFDD